MANGFVHIELGTDDVAKAKKFYKSLFDWKITDVPDMSYTLIDAGKGSAGGGMMKKQTPDQPTMWLPYVEVDSVKKTVAKAKKAGATAMVEYMAIGDMGAIGVLMDPTGAAFGIWEKSKTPPRATKKVAKKKKKAGKRR